ncbi:MAG: FAD:protein FMN transferase [Bdellovibrionales bacterium]|nr:FAD:protein FMN transferase [Bdellovibrionales bacterium]
MNQINLLVEERGFADALSKKVVEEVQRIETKFSRYKQDSIISRINAAAGKDPVRVDPETAGLLDYAEACFRESSGLFDITSGILRRAWDFKGCILPSKDAVENLLPLIGWNLVEWEKPLIRLKKPGMEIDFGGIGKEFAVDSCVALCMQAGAHSGFLNFAGDIFVLGPRQNNQAWQIGVKHPRKKSEVLTTISLTQGALATSGDYERYIEIDGRRYCHILNPKTGYPVQDFQSVTVMGPSCLVAGSIATITMLLGKKRGESFLRSNKVSSVLVDSKGLKSSFPPQIVQN